MILKQSQPDLDVFPFCWTLSVSVLFRIISSVLRVCNFTFLCFFSMLVLVSRLCWSYKTRWRLFLVYLQSSVRLLFSFLDFWKNWLAKPVGFIVRRLLISDLIFFMQIKFSDFVCLLGSIQVKHFPPAGNLLRPADSPISKCPVAQNIFLTCKMCCLHF